MQFGFIKSAAATPEITVADCKKNAKSIIACMERAYADGVRLLVLPELCITGCTCGDLFLQDALQRAATDALAEILEASRATDMLTVLGMPLAIPAGLYNCGIVLQRGRILGVVPKADLQDSDTRVFSPAPQQNTDVRLLGETVPFGSDLLFACETVPELILGVVIGEDLLSPMPHAVNLVQNGASIICNATAEIEAVTKADHRRKLIETHSTKLLCGYLFADAGYGESTTDAVFSGHNLLTENGTMLFESKPFGSGYAVSEFDLPRILRERRRFGRSGMPGAECTVIPFSLTSAPTALTRSCRKMPFVADSAEERASRCDTALAIQAQGLKKRIAHTGVKKVILGVSGGLDSTLALIVAKEAMALLGRPATDVLAVTMPCFGTSKRTRSNAERLCDALGVPCRTIDITAAVTQHLKDLNHPLDVADTAYENAQARERTQVLMNLSNMENGLVVGTGDLSELALGFATYNGDHMSMYGVNAGIPKTFMRSMLTVLADRDGGALGEVLHDIVATPVSPELLPGKDGEIAQITEDIVGPYDLHDFFLYHTVRLGESREKILHLAKYAFSDDYSEDTIEKWLDGFYRRFFSQQFKRSCMPDGPHIGSVSLSPRGDWRMPSDASAAAWRK